MSTLRPPPPVDGPIDAERIRDRTRRLWSGNRTRDLASFAVGDELTIADDEWHLESMRRHCADEVRRRAQGRER